MEEDEAGDSEEEEEDDHAEQGGGEENRRKPKCFKPRRYQAAIYEVALRRNTIAMLKTGAGKTMISLMLMKHFGKEIAASCKKQIIVFLAPTVHLVNQQYEQIAIHTDLDVAQYYGAMGVDEWTAKCWEEEISAHQVMVMTPQILLDALRKAFLTLDVIHFIIFDECHRATGNHPYTRIMKEFYHRSTNKPHVFGMTASPITKKVVSSVTDCEDQIDELQSILDCKIYTVADKTELEALVPSANEIKAYYEPMPPVHEGLVEKLESLWTKFDGCIESLQKSSQNQFEDSDNVLKSSRKRLSSYYMKITNSLKTLGLTCAREAAKVCMENVTTPCSLEEDHIYQNSILQCSSFLEEVLRIVEEVLPQDHELLLKVEHDCFEAVKLGFISPKLYKLIQFFRSFGTSTQVLCLIFVERKITAKVIQRIVRRVGCLSHLEVSYLTGGSSSVDALTQKMQKDTLDLFRLGKVNLLFTTDVAEEGIHVPNCSCVIRFDLPKTVRSYVQSRGRARQSGSHYVMMLERGNNQQRDLLCDIIRSEHSMVETALKSDPDTSVSNFCCNGDLHLYSVESTGATVTADSSVSLLQKYCDKLPKDKYFKPKPHFLVSCLYGGSYQCTLTLPKNAAFSGLVGPISRNSHLAKQLACLDACKKLHQIGALNDHLLPFYAEPIAVDHTEKNKESATGAGTTKRKELHGTVAIQSLVGIWAHKMDAITLQAYRINFVCDIVGQNYSSFALIIDSPLEDDVSHLELDLHLVDKVVKASVYPCGTIHLDAEKVEKSKVFQEFFFNGLFGKLFSGSKSSGKCREFMFNLENPQLWNSSYMYLLLPVNNSCGFDNLDIDWKTITACSYVVEHMKRIYSPSIATYPTCAIPCPVVPTTCIVDMERNKPDIIQLAHKSVQFSDVKDMIVLAIHTGKIYSVLDIAVNKSANSPFEASSENQVSPFTSYTDYFCKKYGIVLQHPGQPLLRLKHSHNPHNLLSSKFACEGSSKSNDGVKKLQSHAHMPPELLVHVDVPIGVLKSFYLLPSLMHRMESLMLACQLRHEVGTPSGHKVPAALILEAITTLRCCEDFSLERLELLGDSVLKYAISCAVFVKFPQHHEGQLSDSRSRAVCNATLHKLGISRNVQGYIRDAAFDPRRWVAPGQASLRPVRCKCGVDNFEVPLKIKYEKEESSFVLGKACDNGHRWMCSKTIADCVEALIGAYFVGGGLTAALSFMNWLGMDVNFELSLVEEHIRAASLRFYLPKITEIEALESKVNYKFSTKGLLLEAITHASNPDLVAYCYQRLEFLGDAVLDLLITRYLFKRYTNIDPGELTDLRSASVNNENFARVAIKHRLQQHLQHGSAFLLNQITDFAKSFEESADNKAMDVQTGFAKVPKVLGDIVESIAGAILIDTKLDLHVVWKIYEPLLSPIVTPENLELPPFRELSEMCSHLGYFIRVTCLSKGEAVIAQLGIQLEDELLVESGCEKSSKGAKGHAAALLLRKLKERGLSHFRHSLKRKQQDSNFVKDSSCAPSDLDHKSRELLSKKQKPCSSGVLVVSQPSLSSSEKPSNLGRSDILDGQPSGPVLLSVKLQKGGPRSTLYEFCRKLQWPAPAFESEEVTSTVDSANGVAVKKNDVKRFMSKITLHIPNSAVIKLTGEERLDKKSSSDSAALKALYELQKLGRCSITEL